MVSNEKRREYNRRYREKHRDKVKEQVHRWHVENQERVRQRAKEYYIEKVKNNPEALAKRAEYHAKWQRDNKDKWNAYHREYCRRKKERI